MKPKMYTVETDDGVTLVYLSRTNRAVGCVFYSESTGWNAVPDFSDIGHNLIDTKQEAIDLIVNRYAEYIENKRHKK